MLRTLLSSGAAFVLLAGACLAGDIAVEDPYARSSGPSAKAGAAFLVLRNSGTEPDRLVTARSDVSQRVELHTHIAGDNGVMRMTEIEGGIEIPAGGEAVLKRGGDHVMFMGLNRPLLQGETVEVTLEFEKAGTMTVEIPVDLERKPKAHH